MKIKRIVANVPTDRISDAKAFYGDVMGLLVAMDHGWITTFAGDGPSAPQISFASSGGSDAPVPDFSVEVDDLDEALMRVGAAGVPIEYGPVTEPWGVRRFFVRDPFGKLVNILQHMSEADPLAGR